MVFEQCQMLEGTQTQWLKFEMVFGPYGGVACGCDISAEAQKCAAVLSCHVTGPSPRPSGTLQCLYHKDWLP